MLKAGLQLSLGQSLTMTPQLQQAIRLLQLSSIELQAEIQEQLENNPMLELDESGDDNSATADPSNVERLADPESRRDQRLDDGLEDGRAFGDPHDGEATPDPAHDAGAEAAANESVADDIPEELPLDSRWEDIYDQPNSASRHGEVDDRDPFERIAGGDGDLVDHLIWQIHLSPLGELERDIAMFIVESVRPDGYLDAPIAELHATFIEQSQASADAAQVPLDAFIAVQHWVQHLDPVGCACETPQDSLLAQLCALNRDVNRDLDQDALDERGLRLGDIDIARRIVRDHFDALSRRDHRSLARALGVPAETIQRAIQVIQALDPRPGSRVSSTPTEYVAPDVYVVQVPGVGWQARINPDIAPNLRVNELYARYAREARNSRDAEFMKGHLQEARWFLKSLQARNDTMLRVAQAIVDRQTGFLEHGEVGMRPMVLRDIAEALSLHESTISRVTQGKYLHTPRGLYEFKYFFSSHVSTDGGGECSATAIRAMLRELIDNESPARPLSDARLAAILQERGIQVARRTVAKYREGMQIPSSSERRVTV